MTAPRADVPAMLREKVRTHDDACEIPALADYAAAADALLDVGRISERVCTRVLDVVTYAGGRDWTAVQQMADEVKRVRKACAELTTARAALAKALEGGEG